MPPERFSDDIYIRFCHHESFLCNIMRNVIYLYDVMDVVGNVIYLFDVLRP